MFGCVLTLERNPDAAAAIRVAGLDVCCNSQRWESHFDMGEEEERARIARAVYSLERTVRQRLAGWHCCYGPATTTRGLLAEHGGFAYDSDS